MFRTILTSVVAGLLLFTSCAQTNNEVLSLLKPGKHIASIATSDYQSSTPRLDTISMKVQYFMGQHETWFRDSMPFIADLTPYHSKFNLTKEEFNDYLKFRNNVKKYIQDSLEIIKKGNLLTFKGMGKLKMLDSLIIDLSKNKAVYKGYAMKFVKKIEVPGVSNLWNTPGYSFEYAFEDGPAKLPESISVLQQTSKTMVGLYIGKNKERNKTSFFLTANRFDKGSLTMNDNISFYLD